MKNQGGYQRRLLDSASFVVIWSS